MILFPGLIGSICKVFTSLLPGWNQQSILSGSLSTANDNFGNSVALNSNGDCAVVGGAGGQATYPLAANTYIFRLTDTAGDGWTGNTMQIRLFPSGTPIHTLGTTFTAGSGPVEEYVVLTPSVNYSLFFVGGGTFPQDVRAQIINSTGAIIYTQTASAVPPTTLTTWTAIAGSGLTGTLPDSSGLAYIYNRNGNIWSQTQTLTGSLASSSFDNFGSSVAIDSSANTVVVGARSDEAKGLAYIFKKDSSIWTQQKILSGSLAIASGDLFGTSVAINSSGNRIIVGSLFDERTGTTGEGLAYVFTSGSIDWTQEAILSGTLAVQANDQFGISVAINSTGDRIIVGANQDERTGTTGEGLAYVFTSGSSGWTQEVILSGTLAIASSDFFGVSVALNSVGDVVVVGASSDERTGTNNEGLAYTFISSSGGWAQQTILSGTLATVFGDSFGTSVAINSIGNKIIIGARVDERTGTTGEGLAYTFISSSGGWVQEKILSGSLATTTNDNFGNSVGINSAGDYIIVGASGDERTGTNNEGLTYIFVSGS